MYSSILGLFTKGGNSIFIGVIVSLFVSLIFALWLYKNALREISVLEVENQTMYANVKNLVGVLDEQNQAIMDLEVKETKRDLKSIEKITIKDKTCESLLQGYKEIFKELSK